MAKATDAYVFYQDYVKPLYCEIEARNNTLPVELLFEIHAAFDHLRRFYVDGEDEEASTIKALGHLKRGSLDAFKLKLKYFNEDIGGLKKKIDFTIIDSGKFYPNLISDKNNIVQLAKRARLLESKEGHVEAFEYWSMTSIAIDEFYEKYLADKEKLTWARRQTVLLNLKDSWRAFVVGLLSGIASSLFVWWMTNQTL